MARLLVLLSSILSVSFASQAVFPDSRGSLENLVTNVYGDPSRGFSSGDQTFSTNSFAANAIPLDSTHKENSISNGLNNFALNMNKVILNRNGNGRNVILSPLSIAGALSLVLLGSVGKTYNELSTALGFFNDITSSRNVHREFANLIDKITSPYQNHLANVTYASGVFLKKDLPIRPQYEDFVRTIYRSSIRHLDFQNNNLDAQRIINKWVYDATNGKIQNLLSSPPVPDTQLILTSALHFVAEWEKFFIDGITVRSPFILDKRYPDIKVDVDMMGNEGHFPFYRSKEHECMLVGLPYRGNNTVLYAIKPIDATKKDLRQIINDFSAETLDNLIRSATRQSTLVTFPKMKLSGTYEMRPVLEEMGVRSIFNSNANLALLSPALHSPPSRPTLMKVKHEEQNDDPRDQFIFSRFGGDDNSEEDDCSKVFKAGSATSTNCTTTKIIDGKNVTVIYKKLGDKIGRRVVKRSAENTSLNKHWRLKRQSIDTMNPGLFVDRVLHKVDIDITETGTEASAATAVFITKGGYRPVFTANEPFFFIIRDEETKFILFSAAVYKPEPNYS